MRDYEIVYIFRSTLTSEEIGAKLERYHAIITGDGSGEITASAHWGKRQFAYPILKQKNGYYVIVQFTSEPAPLTELERVLKLEDDLLRYLIVIAEHPLPSLEATPESEVSGEAAATASEEAEGGDAGDEDSAEEDAGEEDAGKEDAADEDSAEEDAGEEDAADEASSDENSAEKTPEDDQAEEEGSTDEPPAEAGADEETPEEEASPEGADAGEEPDADGEED